MIYLLAKFFRFINLSISDIVHFFVSRLPDKKQEELFKDSLEYQRKVIKQTQKSANILIGSVVSIVGIGTKNEKKD